jgi:hypothetical protein
LLPQESHFGGARELFVEGDDLIRAVGETDLGNQLIRETAATSVITLNPAIRDRVKSGHREWPKT